jgi:hypothetical protein
MNKLFNVGADLFFNFLKDNYDKKKKIYKKLGFSLNGAISFRDWEVLVAILMRDKCKSGHGCDLKKHEVKSAQIGNSFEYQYHKNTGLLKLEEDKIVNHIFVSYSENYSYVEIKKIESNSLKIFFDDWKQNIIESYQKENPKQRCRQSIPYGFVKKHGEIIWKNDSRKLTPPTQPL